PTNPDIVLVCALGRAYGPQQQRGVYRTTDGGRTWTRALFVDANTGCADLAIDPGDPNTLFAGMWQFEVKTWHLQSGGPGSGLWVSRDGGATWKRLAGHGLPDPKRVVGKSAVAVAPSNPNTVYALIEDQDPALYRSADRGNTWRRGSRNHDMAERAPYYVYGNRQDGSSYRMPSRSLAGRGSEGEWRHVGGCESGFGIPDTVDNATVWSGCYDGGLEVYDVRTDHARNVRVWPEAGYGWRPADMKYRWNWTFPIAISPHDHTKVYVGSQVVHVTKDGGASWQVISPDLTRNDTTHQQSS